MYYKIKEYKNNNKMLTNILIKVKFIIHLLRKSRRIGLLLSLKVKGIISNIVRNNKMTKNKEINTTSRIIIINITNRTIITNKINMANIINIMNIINIIKEKQ